MHTETLARIEIYSTLILRHPDSDFDFSTPLHCNAFPHLEYSIPILRYPPSPRTICHDNNVIIILSTARAEEKTTHDHIIMMSYESLCISETLELHFPHSVHVARLYCKRKLGHAWQHDYL